MKDFFWKAQAVALAVVVTSMALLCEPLLRLTASANEESAKNIVAALTFYLLAVLGGFTCFLFDWLDFVVNRPHEEDES